MGKRPSLIGSAGPSLIGTVVGQQRPSLIGTSVGMASPVMTPVRRPSQINGAGYKVDQVVVPYNPADVDHIKNKPLDHGGTGYEFSSPFAFSQGDSDQMTSAPSMSSAAVYSSAPPPGPYSSMPTQQASYSSMAMQACRTSSVVAFDQNMVEARYRPPMYPQQGGYGQQPPQYGGPPPGYYQQGPPQPPPGPLEGWLAKRSDGGIASGWQMRWWRLENCVMKYSRDERGVEAGGIQLTAKCEVRALKDPHATVEGRMMGPKKPFAFEVYQGVGMRTYYLDAGSEEKKRLWIGAIGQAIGALRQSAWSQGGQQTCYF